MPKTKISEYSATANSNTDVGGINIDEGCAPSGINDAIRTMMAQLKNFQTGTGSDSFNGPVGSTTASTGAFTTLSATGNVTLGDASTDTLNVGNGGLVKDASGNVGIGTGSPTTKLDVVGSGDGELRLRAGSDAALIFSETTANKNWKIKPSGGDLYWQYSATAYNSGYSSLMVLQASGNLGIGTTSPAAKLTVSASDPEIRLIDTSGTSTYGSVRNIDGRLVIDSDAGDSLSSSTIEFKIDGFEKARIDAGGNMGLGSASPTGISGYTALKINNATNGAILDLAQADTMRGRLVATSGSFSLETSGSIPILFSTGGSEDARIDSSGNLLVGTTNAAGSAGQGVKLLPSGVVRSVTTNTETDTYNYFNTTAAAYRFYVTNAGVINATSTTITAISDQRLKENVRDLDTGLDSIMALQPRRFDWKEGKGQDKKNVAGFIAQEFETVFPECVGTSKAGGDGIEYKNINHETLIPTLVKAIQELNAKFEAYKATHP